ncbi:hypothetical protein PENTCL1PPCAC_2269, partial [Pristionchus entomophagus]
PCLNSFYSHSLLHVFYIFFLSHPFPSFSSPPPINLLSSSCIFIPSQISPSPSLLFHLSFFSFRLDMLSSFSIPCLRCGNEGGSPPFGSFPMSLHKVGSLNRSLAVSINSSRGDSGCSSLELEAVAAMHELSFAVQSICVSEMLPRTGDLLFVNLTTTEGTDFCLELTLKGWRITSLRSDCMIGDFTKLEMFIKYYDSLYGLLDDISPGYRQRFGERVAKKLMMLQNEDSSDIVAPSSSYCSPPFSMSPSDSTQSLPIVTPVPSPVPKREERQRDTVIA